MSSVEQYCAIKISEPLAIDKKEDADNEGVEMQIAPTTFSSSVCELVV